MVRSERDPREPSREPRMPDIPAGMRQDAGRGAVSEHSLQGHGEPDPATCFEAIMVLLHGLPPEQHVHAVKFLLEDLERLYQSARCRPPGWINLLRASTPLGRGPLRRR